MKGGRLEGMGEAIGLRVVRQAPVVQTSDSAIHRINHYPADKYWENRLHYPLDSVIHLLDNWTLLVFLRGEMGLNLE